MISNPDSVNEAIKEIVLRHPSIARALVIFSEQRATLIMPAGGIGSDGKRYVIWPNLSSREEAKAVAMEWGGKMPSVEIAYQREEDIPEDPEVMLVNSFILKFSL